MCKFKWISLDFYVSFVIKNIAEEQVAANLPGSENNPRLIVEARISGSGRRT